MSAFAGKQTLRALGLGITIKIFSLVITLFSQVSNPLLVLLYFQLEQEHEMNYLQ
jgi:hypothetical protein